jgi:acylphosphatase
MELVCRRWIFRGRVQGVGFRATARCLASGFAISGYVQNLPDGCVEVVACGRTSEIQGFLTSISRSFSNQIRECVESSLSATPEIAPGFSIRY